MPASVLLWRGFRRWFGCDDANFDTLFTNFLSFAIIICSLYRMRWCIMCIGARKDYISACCLRYIHDHKSTSFAAEAELTTLFIFRLSWTLIIFLSCLTFCFEAVTFVTYLLTSLDLFIFIIICMHLPTYLGRKSCIIKNPCLFSSFLYSVF